MNGMQGVPHDPTLESVEGVELVPGTSPRDYTVAECVFAWISLIAGYLFCRAFPIASNPVGGFALVFSMFVAATVILKLRGVKISAMPVVAALSAIVVSTALVLTSNGFLHFFAYSYAITVFCYYLYSATGNSIKSGFTDLIVIDFVKTLFVLPFSSFGLMFKAMFSGKAKGSGKFIGKLLIGVAVTIVPTAIVMALLSYDSGFSDLLSKIFDFSILDIFSHMVSFGFGIPIGMYIFGLFISSVENKCKNSITAESCTHAASVVRVAPAVTVTAAVLPLLFLYVVFFISQWQYYVSGFTGVLPEEFSYAEYAREGFFQLCAVSVINLIVIVSVMMFMRRKNDRPPLLLKVTAIIFSGFTLILISTAISKLFMYIDFYGLTPKRVYAAWLMAVLALIFVIIAVKQFVPKLNAVAASLAVSVAMFAVLSVANADGIIAWYNVDRYLNGSLEEVDVDLLSELGDAAVPEMVHLVKELDSRETNDAEGILREQLMQELRKIRNARFEEGDTELFAKTIPYIRAERALREIDFS